MLRLLTFVLLLGSFQKSFAQNSCQSLFPSDIGSMKITQIEQMRGTPIYLKVNKDITLLREDDAYRSFQASRGIWLIGLNYYKVKITFNASNVIPKDTVFKMDSYEEIGAHDGYESAIYMSSDDRKYKYPRGTDSFFASFELEIDGAGKNTIKDLTVDQIESMLGHVFTLSLSPE